jgi:hypothetical protein
MSRQSALGVSAHSSSPSRGNEISTLDEQLVWGPVGSGSEGQRKPFKAGHGCKFFPADRPLPVALQLRLGPDVRGGSRRAGSLRRLTPLLHAQEDEFAGCWFSSAVRLGDQNGSPAFWMLRKTATDTWQLSLRRGNAVVAAYRAKTKSTNISSIRLKMVRAKNRFKQWPATVTISE